MYKDAHEHKKFLEEQLKCIRLHKMKRKLNTPVTMNLLRKKLTS